MASTHETQSALVGQWEHSGRRVKRTSERPKELAKLMRNERYEDGLKFINSIINDTSFDNTSYPQYFMYMDRAYCYHELGEYEKAIKDYDKVIILNNEFWFAHTRRGDAYMKLGEYEIAKQAAEKVLENCHYQSGDGKVAVRLLSHAESEMFKNCVKENCIIL